MKSMRRLFAMLLAIIMLLVNGSLAALAENVLSLPAALQVIGEEAFYGDTSIDKVVLPEGVTAIEARAFADSTLSEINLPASLTSIDDSAFDGPEQVTVTAQEGTYAYEWAVANGYIREPMAWPESDHPYVDDGESETWDYVCDDPDAIALSATFSEETYFEENADFLYIIEADGRQNSYTGGQLAGATVVLPGDRFTLHLMKNGSVGAYGFRFEDIHVMSEAEYADYLAQQEAHAFDIRVRGDGTAVISGYSGSDAVLYIPAEIDGHAIVGIGGWAFAYNSNITRVVIPNGVEYISYGAFYGCSNLTKVDIAGTVEYIDSEAFYNCTRLTDVTLREGIKEIGWEAFHNCESLTKITLPASLTRIEYGAFGGCPLETVEANEDTYAYFWAVENGYITPEGDFVVLARARHGTLAHNGDDLILEYLSGNWEYIELLIRAQDDVTVQCTNECVEYYGDDYDEDGDGNLAEGIVFPGEGNLTVHLKPNLGGAEREAVITFTCDEQTRTVTLRQLPHLLAEIVAPEGLGINMGYFDDTTEPPRKFFPLGEIEFAWRTVEDAVSYSIGLSTPVTQADSDDIAYFIEPNDIVDGQIHFTVTEDLLQPTGRMDNYIYLRVKDSHGYTYETPACFGVYDPASPEWGYKTYYAYDDETEEEYEDGIMITGYMGDSMAPVVPSQIGGQTVRALSGRVFRDLDITDITLPNTLYEIGYDVFSGLEHLPSVAIPEGVTYIGEEAFYNCTGLNDVSLPDTLESIGYAAFQDCTSLGSIDLPEDLTYIYDEAFSGCTALTSIVIPDGVTDIWSGTFRNCTSLESVTLPANLQQIYWGAFEDCVALGTQGKISIPGSVTSISSSAFEGCDNLVGKYSAPEGSYAYNWGVEYGFIPEDYVFESDHPITSDGDFEYHYTHETEADGLKLTFSARSRFSGLSLSYDGGSDWYSGDWEGKNTLAGKTVVIPGNHFDITLNVDSTGRWGFGITAIEPMTAEEITAWKDANPFLYEDYSQYDPNTYSWINGIRITKYQGSAAEVTVPATIDGKRVICIGGNTFYGRSDLTSIFISEGVRSIESSAFWYCPSLTSVTLPGSITQINGDSIYGSSNLIITAPEGSYAWNWAQENGYGIENAVLESTHPFYSDEAVEYEYNGPAGTEMLKVTFSKRTFFYNGMSLTQSDGSIHYYYGDNLAGKTLYLPGDHFTITLYPVNQGSDPYFGFRITDVTPMSVAEYETYRTEHPFTTRSWGDDLAITGYIGPDTDLVIPEYYEGKRVAYIDYQAFYDHDELTSVVIPDSVYDMNSAAFDSCSNLVSVTLPSGMWYISNDMFSGCTSLAEIEIPDNVQSISNYAFYNCKSLTSLALSGNVSYIEDDAFRGCTNLTIDAPEGSFAWNWAMEHGYMYEESVLESDHPYTPESEHTFTYVHPEPADSLKVTFSARTEVSNAWITDVNGHTVNYYGDTLKGRTLYFPGNSFTMRLDEWSSDCFGFRITDITPMTAEEYDAYRAEHPFETNPWDDGVQITNYIGADTSLVIPSTIDGKTVYYLGYQAFANNTELTSVVILDSVTGMDSYVFENCTGLTSVTLPGSLHSITNDVFRGCSALEEVIIPEGIQNIYHYAFYGCTSLTSLYLPASVNDIDDTAFYGCTNLTITAPEGSYAYNWAVAHGFAGGTTPTSEPTNTPEPTTTPGTAILESDHPFTGSSTSHFEYSYVNAVDGLKLTFSPECRFSYLTLTDGNEESISFSTDNTDGSENGLAGRTIVVRGSTFTIDMGTYGDNLYGFAITAIEPMSYDEMNAWNAEHPFIAKSYRYYDYSVGNTIEGAQLIKYVGTATEVEIPDTIDGMPLIMVGPYTFYRRSDLTSIVVPEGVHSISYGVFDYCTNLTSLTLPASLTSISSSTIYGCPNLTVTAPEGSYAWNWAQENGYIPEYAVLESTHPFVSEEDVVYDYTYPGEANMLKVTFSRRTYSSGMFVTQANGISNWYYGDLLSGQTLILAGNSFRITMQASDSEDFGFLITDVLPLTGAEYDSYRSAHPFMTRPSGDYVIITRYIGTDTEVVVPNIYEDQYVSNIDNQAFSGNTELTSVVISEGVGSYYLGREVFMDCTNLNSVTLPAGWTELPYRCFGGCTSLETVNIPSNSSLETIGNNAFFDCANLMTLQLPASVEDIADDAFDGCTNLTITAPEGSYAYNWAVAHGFAVGTTPEPAILESDHPYADDADQTWTYVHPESAAALRVTFSQDTFFEEGCDYLYITDSIGTQKSYTGNELSGAELILSGNSFTLRLTSDGSVTEHGFAISDITALSQEEYDAYLAENLYEYHIMGDGTVEISGYNGTNGVVTLPTEIDGYVISGIGMRAFMNSALIAEVTIPEGMEYIGSMAFYGCTNLTKVVIPGTVKRIGGEAFYGCTSLNDVTLGEGIERIEWGAFANCTALTSITLPESLKFIDDEAFSDSGLSTVKAEENSYAYIWAVDRGYITPEGELVILPMLEEGTILENGDVLLGGGWVDVSIIVRAQDDVTMTSAADCVECYDYNTGENADLTTGFTVLAESRIDIRLLPNLTGATRDTVLTFTCGELTRTMTLRQLPYLLAEIVAPAGLGVDPRHFDDDAETPRAFLELGDIEFAWSTVEGATRYFVGVDTPGHYMDSDDNAAYVEINPEDIVGGVIRFTVPEEDLRPTGRMDHHVYLRAVDAYGYTYDTPVCFGVYDAAYPEWGYRDYEVYDEQTGEEYTDGLEIIGYMGSNTAPTVPGEIDGQVVKSIGDNAFEGSDITGITLPNTLIQICEEAFTGCDYLTSVVIPEGVTSIYYSAFGGCDRLASVTLPNSLTYLDGYTFCNCPALTTIVIPDGVTSVSPETFSGCTGLQSVTLPEGIDQIGWAAFEGCTALTEIGISANVTYIDDTAFNGCTNLTITAPEGSYAYNWAVSNGFIGQSSLLPAPVLTLTEEEPASDLWMAVMLDQSYDEVRAWRYKDGQPIYGDDATIWTNTDHIGYFQFEPGEYRFVVDCRKGGAWTEQAEITFTVVDGYIDKLRPAPALVMVPAEPKPGDWTTIFLGQRYDTIRALGYMNDQPMYDGEATIWEDNYCIGAFQYEPGDYRFVIDCMKNGGWTEQAEITFSVSENAGGSLLPAPTLTLDPTAPTSENWTSIHLDQTYDEVRAWAYKNGELYSDETIWYNTNHIGAFQYEYGRYLYIVDCRKGGSWTERATITFTVAWGEELEPAPWILDPS